MAAQAVTRLALQHQSCSDTSGIQKPGLLHEMPLRLSEAWGADSCACGGHRRVLGCSGNVHLDEHDMERMDESWRR